MQYWNGKGRYQEFAELLQKLIPEQGSVHQPWKNKYLERYRKVVNAYYRLFNDGDSNGRMLGVYHYDLPNETYMSIETRERHWESIGKVADKALEQALVAAYKEQYGTTIVIPKES